MGNGSVVGAVIMALCCFGCGLTFSCIASCAKKSKKPFHFWSGSKVDPEKVTDIPAYNRANAAMWRVYAIPYWIAGVFGCLGFLGDIFATVSAVIMFLACIPGVFFLVLRYTKIEKEFVRK